MRSFMRSWFAAFLAIALASGAIAQPVQPQTQGVAILGGANRLPSGFQSASVGCFFSTGQLFNCPLTTVRALPKACDDTAGNWGQVPSNTLCYTNKGALIEQPATNGIRNNSAQGIVVAPTLIANGLFYDTSTWTTGLSGGTGTVVFGAAQLTLTGDGTNEAFAEQSMVTAPGATYNVSGFTSGANVNVEVGTTQGAHDLLNTSGANFFRLQFTASGATTWLRFGRNTASPVILQGTSVIAELVTNGNFVSSPINASQNTPQNGWQWNIVGGTSTVTYSNPNVVLTADGSGNAANFQGTTALTTIAGHTYNLSIDASGGTSVTVRVGTAVAGSTLLNVSSGMGIGKRFQFVAGSTTSFISFVNSTASTAVTLTRVSVQDAGQLPTNQDVFNNNTGTGIQVVSNGTENGVEYFDLCFFGLATAAAEQGVHFEAGGQFATALNGIVATSVFWRTLGTATNIASVYNGVDSFASGPAFIGTYRNANQVASGSAAGIGANRMVFTPTITDATVATTRPVFFVQPSATTNTFIIVRLGWPQIEAGVTSQLLGAPTVAGAVAGSPGTLPFVGGASWASSNVGTETRTLALPTISGQNVLDVSLAGGALPAGTEYDINPQASFGGASVTPVAPGDVVVATAYYQTVTDDAGFTAVFLEVLFGNSSNVEISRTSTAINKAAGALTLYQVQAVAPALTTQAFVRVRHVYSGTPTVTYRYYVGPWTSGKNTGYASSPIRTTNAAVARPGDVVTGTFSFGSAYSVFINGRPNAPVTYGITQTAAQIDDTSNTNRLVLFRPLDIGLAQAGIVNGGSFSGFQPNAVWAQNANGKIVAATAASDQSAYFNGANNATAAAATPVVTTFHLGALANATQFWNGYIISAALWLTTRIPNSLEQAISTPYLLKRDLEPAANDNTPAFLDMAA
jgi:hypothetical protein